MQSHSAYPASGPGFVLAGCRCLRAVFFLATTLPQLSPGRWLEATSSRGVARVRAGPERRAALPLPVGDAAARSDVPLLFGPCLGRGRRPVSTQSCSSRGCCRRAEHVLTSRCSHHVIISSRQTPLSALMAMLPPGQGRGSGRRCGLARLWRRRLRRRSTSAVSPPADADHKGIRAADSSSSHSSH